jgi:hypothetical protein
MSSGEDPLRIQAWRQPLLRSVEGTTSEMLASLELRLAELRERGISVAPECIQECEMALEATRRELEALGFLRE